MEDGSTDSERETPQPVDTTAGRAWPLPRPLLEEFPYLVTNLDLQRRGWVTTPTAIPPKGHTGCRVRPRWHRRRDIAVRFAIALGSELRAGRRLRRHSRFGRMRDGLSRALEAPRVDSVGRDERPRCAESTSDVPRSKTRAVAHGRGDAFDWRTHHGFRGAVSRRRFLDRVDPGARRGRWERPAL